MSYSEITRNDILPNSARYVLTYLRVRHLVDCVDNVTFRDIVQGTGLSPRTIRKALAILKTQGLIKVTRDVKHSRRHLYQLNFRKALKALGYPKMVEPGVYLVDVGLGLKKFLSPRALAVLQSSDVVYTTDNVPSQILELIPEDTKMYTLTTRIPSINIDKDCVTVVLYDSLLDCEEITKFVENVPPDSKVKHIPSTTPIDYALHLLEARRSCKVVFKRSPVSLEIYVRKVPSYVSGDIVRCFRVEYSCESGIRLSVDIIPKLELDELAKYNIDNMALIIYVRR